MTAHQGRDRPRNVPALLARLHGEGFTGAVTVSGGPGGRFHLHDGLVGAVQTPTAPDASSLLLKSGRVGGGDWSAALAALPEAGDLASVLTAHGLVRAAELEVVCAAAVFDGALGMALQPVTGWELLPQSPPPLLVSRPGLSPAALTEEVARRLGWLRERHASVREFAQTPLLAVPQPGTDALLPRHQDLLRAVNGRRTPRDLAFVLGRGVFAVMADVCRLTARHLLAPNGAGPVGSPLLSARRPEPRAPLPTGQEAPPLPRRRPAASAHHPHAFDPAPSGQPPKNGETP